MGTRNHSQGGTYRINLKLDSRDDADIIAWLKTCPNGQRSEAVREAIRRGLGVANSVEPGLGLEAIRQVIADEIARSLGGLRFQSQADQEPPDATDAESRYGVKLNRMLDGLTRRTTDNPEGS
jgi:hypothetical protein